MSRKVAAIEKVKIEDLALDFTIPGYDMELRVCPITMVRHGLGAVTHLLHFQPGGRDIAVTSDNVHEYIDEVVEAIVGKGVRVQVQAFKAGFSKVFPVADLRAFTADELVMLFGNSEEDWSIESECLVPGPRKLPLTLLS